MAHTCRGTINLAGAALESEDSCNFVISNGGAQVCRVFTGERGFCCPLRGSAVLCSFHLLMGEGALIFHVLFNGARVYVAFRGSRGFCL